MTPTPVAPADASPPGYVPPPAYPPPPVLYGPSPVYLQPVYGPPPFRVRIYPTPGNAAPAAPPAAASAPRLLQPFTHDGFYFRAGVGGGITSASRDRRRGVNRVTVLGGSASISVAVGWSVAQNLALFGDLAVSGISTPDVKVNGVAMNTAGTNSTFGGFAAGVACLH